MPPNDAYASPPATLDGLFPHAYEELKRLATRYVRAQKTATSLGPTALVHEAFLKLHKDRQQDWGTRASFLAAAAASMRRIVIDCHRRRKSAKRGGDWVRKRLTRVSQSQHASASANYSHLDLDAALARLTCIDPRKASIVILRFLWGLSVEDTAAALQISTATVKQEWSFARAWLQTQVEL